jgi:hypothetical protein
MFKDFFLITLNVFFEILIIAAPHLSVSPILLPICVAKGNQVVNAPLPGA